jgi:NAD dependent epimerase/dehydratase family enzyme
MNVILFGATGMVGQGVLRECLLDADVQSVLSLGRSASGQQTAKIVTAIQTRRKRIGLILSLAGRYQIV